jgi:hypothetical protein
MKFSFQMDTVMNTLPMWLHKMCMLNVTLKADNTTLWKALLTTELMAMLLLLMKCTSNMAATRKWGKQPKVGTFVLSRKMVLQAGSACQTSRKATLLRLLNILLPKACLIPLVLSGGPHMYFRNAPELLPLWPTVITSGPISLELKFQRAGMTVWNLTSKMTTLSGRMWWGRRWRMLELHSRF